MELTTKIYIPQIIQYDIICMRFHNIYVPIDHIYGRERIDDE